jgi:hypothetical protein
MPLPTLPFDATGGQDTIRLYKGGVVPDDWVPIVVDTDLGDRVAGIYVGVAGDLTVWLCQAAAGQAGRLIKAAPAGAILPGRFRYVGSAGTTATNLMALIFV